MPDHPVFSIGAVARMLGIPVPTLRTWQDRYDVVIPQRSPGGHRLYSRQQLEQLRFLRDRVSAGLSPADAHRLLLERLHAGGRLNDADIPSDGTALLILLAEQDRFAAEFAEYFLRTEGYNVGLVVDEDEALAQTEQTVPDAAVIDLLLSSGRGLQLCAHLHRRFDVPILAISTLELRDEALEAGASAFLQKPLESLQLVATIEDLLGQSGLVRRRTAES
ncbi:response regulator [Pseudonocardia sp. H11422]|uniref:response regulator n=1 Tax=Pseudonocardia sp. H11422 TaxID=2835866 RepID=UPI0027E244FB|nr:response regulator [Pseudonocardia sp. H11422]